MIANNCGKTGVFIVKPIIFSILLLGAGVSSQTIHAQPRDGKAVPDSTACADSIGASLVSASALTHATPTSSFSGESLRRLTADSAADALGLFPGVRIKDYGGIGGMKTVDVRSLGSGHVGIFLDGQRITNAQNGQVDIGRYSPGELESISLTNAQRTALLMTAEEHASGSVVHLRTRTPVFGDKDWNLRANVKAGSWGTFNPSIGFDRKIKGVSLSANASCLSSEGNYRFRLINEYEDTTGRRKGGDVSTFKVGVALRANPAGGSLDLRADSFISDRGLPGPVIRRLSGAHEPADRQKDDDLSIQGSYRKEFGTVAILVNAKVSSDNLRYSSFPSADAPEPSAGNYFRQRTGYLSLAMSWQPSAWISGGLALDNRLSGLHCDVTGFSPVQRIDSKAACSLKLSAGGFALRPSLLLTRIEDFTEGAAVPLLKLSPTVIASWENRSGTIAVRAFWKDIFRAPTFNDLYYTLTGNAAIRPEYATQGDIGFDLCSPKNWKVRSRLSMDGFLNRVKDKIVAVPVNSQFRWSMMNFGLVRGGGASISLVSACEFSGFSLNSLVSYSFEKASDRTDPESIGFGGQIPYTPFHSGSAVLSGAGGPWEISISALFSGIRYSVSDNNPGTRLPGWSTVDLSLTREVVRRPGTRIRAGIDITNLFCTRYEIVRRYPMPGTGACFRITIEL